MNIARIVGFVTLYATGALVLAGSATWNSSPGSGDWNTAANWTPMTVPNGSADTATFALSNITDVSLSANTEVNGIVFNSNASAFTITASPANTLTLSGTGITNNSGGAQNFVAAVDGAGNFGTISFTNSATAGSNTVFTTNGGKINGASGGSTHFFNTATAGSATFTTNGATANAAGGGVTIFFDSSTAGSATFTTNGTAVMGGDSGLTAFRNNSTAGSATFTTNGGAGNGADGGFTEFSDSSSAGSATFTTNGGKVSGAFGGVTEFSDSSSAGSATFTTNGGVSSVFGGTTEFFGNSSAGSATFTTNGGAASPGGGVTVFFGSSTADNATLIANGGTGGGAGGSIQFSNSSTGGTARVEVFGNGNLDISPHNSPGVTVGSIEGSGNIFLGARNLTVGSNDLSTEFSGVIQDGGLSGGMGGSLTKIGAGALTLSGANTYTGATTVNAGTLLVNGSIMSDVTVNGGTFGGIGTVPNITVNSGGTLAPGTSPGILSATGNLTLTLGSTYLVDLDGTAVGTQYDQTKVIGIVSLGSATLSLSLGFTPAIGTQFMIISNSLSDAVVGQFNGLSEGATFTSDGVTFMISYQGGNGNDVVLTVVPEPATLALFLAGSSAFLLRSVRRRILCNSCAG